MNDENFDFSSASQAAIQSLQQPEPQTPAPTEPTAGTPQAQTPTEPAAPLDAKQFFKVKDNGKDLDVSLEDLLSGHLRHRDYTRKTMELATQRKEFETLQTAAQTREAKINAFLRDADQVARYYTFLTGQQLSPQQAMNIAAQQQQPQQSQGPDLNAIRLEMQQQLQGLQQESKKEIAKVQEAMQAQQQQDLDRELTTHIQGILKDDKLKILDDIGDFEEIAEFLCAQAQKLGEVKTLDQAKAAILQVAQAKAERLHDRRKETLKTEAVKKADLTTKGIEPPGGKGVTPAPTNFKLGSKELTQAAIAFVEGSSKKS